MVLSTSAPAGNDCYIMSYMVRQRSMITFMSQLTEQILHLNHPPGRESRR